VQYIWLPLQQVSATQWVMTWYDTWSPGSF
jgi:hypothetical protein